ncbi:MAG: hypothetical protein WAN48_06660, partial [Actinomycetes bacterium]
MTHHPRASGRRRGSLRRRLTVGVTALVVGVLLGVGAATLFTLRTFLIDQLDAQLRQTASQAVDRPFNELRNLPESTLLTQFGADGQLAQSPVLVVGRERGDTGATLSAADLAHLKAVGPTPTAIDLSELGRYRAVATQDAGGRQVVVAQSVKAVQETLGRLLAIEVVALVVATA